MFHKKLHSTKAAGVFPALLEDGRIPIMETVTSGYSVDACDLSTTKEFCKDIILLRLLDTYFQSCINN